MGATPEREELERRIKALEREVIKARELETALRRSEESYKYLVENANDIIYKIDLQGRFTFTNPVASKIAGYSPEEFLGMHYFQLMRPDHHEEAQGFYVSQFTKKLPSTYYEFPMLTKDGSEIWVGQRVQLLQEGARVVGFHAVARDITGRKRAEEALRQYREELERRVEERTAALVILNEKLSQEVEERKRAEDALKQSEKKYRDIFQNVSDFLYFHDLDGRFVETNLAFKKGSGYREDERLPLNARDMIPEPYRDHFDEYLKRIREKGHDEGFLRIATKDGRTLILEYKNSLVHDSEGRPVGVRGSGRDVTERLHAEKEKKRLEGQLHQARRMEAVGTLAGGVAHNFNNLLMGIQGYASLARMDTDSSHPNSHRMESIEELVHSAAKLTTQLLGYASKGRFQVKPFSLNQVVKETSDTFAITRKEIRVHRDLGADPLEIEADQGQIEQVLLNLYVNAADAMPEGGDLFLRTRNTTHEEMKGKPYSVRPGRYVLLTVRDTGVGMDSNTLERIFDPFFTTKEVGKGAGLGLPSVYGIIKAHGGYVDAFSEKGKGAAFEIYLPASRAKATREEAIHEKDPADRGTILLVDDEEPILDVEKIILRKLGYRVVEARGGKEALSLCKENKGRLDLVILDMIMPDMMGGEVYDRMKEIDPNVKILLSSGYSIDGQATEILRRGCDGFIQKPFKVEQLAQKIREILARKTR